jgi:prepilin-type N-terminal cleavage/methylation domain-containing protein
MMRGRGFTLLEAAITLAVLAIVAAAAVPSYHNMLARQQLRAAGEQLALDLRMAREHALRSGQPVFVNAREGAKDWCWGLSSGQPCDCAGGVPACSLGRGRSADFPLLEMSRAADLSFEPRLGRSETTAAFELKSRRGHSLQLQVNAMGRAHLCGPDAPKPQPC